ncbi:MAG: Threonylcarbamoyladenosine tRNA methylthiotransferase MtaB [Alphaproteobacteria bacterium MarineAlpha10_Bin3]|jgi:threonylcarbamoyladenosine tRNA methylthiotransferase MtaB|nr:MAG: Threonylcarbamoyladenosine tRNA methylthiotransferase MtaB [Alphaproteobacteria bacterium MarineAlpha10_Bin3]PPR69195.1 MAG: Threonylcarbamoyladenosine tRNA methylthiotransferase MtaB [Alphaproteobacteria bacterium MarineAlpha4_Bin1]
MKSGPDIVTFGCRLNAFESQVIRDHAASLDNAIIFNTCAVTAEAERQARQAIRRARRARPDAQIIVTGCAAQANTAAFAAMPEVDRVLGNSEKLRADSYKDGARIQVGDIMQAREIAGHLIEGFEGRARAFVQVQQGCDHRCTFCIIPFGRGNSRSVPVGDIVAQTRRLVENGYREIVLTGVDITSYGANLPGRPGLGQMARRLLKLVPELPRLRISSIDCIEIDADLMNLIADEPRLMPHLHLSLQSGDDMILKRMKRRHGRADAIAVCRAIRNARPDIVLGADLIAGFPTETDANFQRSLDLIGECGLTWLHVFPYSPRPGTPAARMPAVPKSLRRERAKRLRDAGAAAVEAFLDARIGRDADVLVESDGIGRTEHYAPIRADHGLTEGAIARLRVTGRSGGILTGRPAA